MNKEMRKRLTGNNPDKTNSYGLKNGAVNFNRKIVFIVLISLLFFFLFETCLAQQNITITNIWYKKMPNFTRVTIKANRPIQEFESMYVGDPDRIVIDVYDADYNITELVKNTLFLNMGSVKQVRCGQIEPDKSRFVIDLFQQADYDMALDSTKHLLQINVYDYKEFLSPEQQIFTVEPLSAEEIRRIKEKELAMVPSLVDQVTIPITMNLKETDVIDALRTLSMLSGINIVADDSVTGQITLNLNQVSFKDALNWILSLKRLKYTQVGNALIVGTEDIIKTYRERVTKIVHLENADVENTKSVLDYYFDDSENIKVTTDIRLNNLILEGLPELVSKSEELIKHMDTSLITKTFKLDNATFSNADDGNKEIDEIKRMLGIIIPDENRIIVDYRQNEIIIKGNQEEIASAEMMIRGLDKRAPQIMIEAKIVEISLDSIKDLGVRWYGGAEEGGISLQELALGSSFERIDIIEAKLKALAVQNKINILSNPKVLTLDGKKSTIDSGKQIPIQEEVTDEHGNIRKTVTWKDVGVKLEITPRLSSDGLINMNLFTEVKSLGEEYIVGYPIINNRSETAIFYAKLGETIGIGGLISTEEIETIRRIPILSEIPIFGELFKFRKTTKNRTEVIILITANKIEY
ncbi:MAG: AMIN domain-containing protein [Atribacterota bacterium]